MGRIDEGLPILRQMSEKRPDDARVHAALGQVVGTIGCHDEAVAELRKAVALAPGEAHFHWLFMTNLARRLAFDEAVAEGRKTVALAPGDRIYRRMLAQVLRDKGDYPAAIAEFRAAGELIRHTAATELDRSASDIRETEGLAKLADRLPDVLQGGPAPGGVAERIALAGLAVNRGLYAAAARLYGEAIDPGAKPGDNAQYMARYNGAVAAALASCGQGRDDPQPDDAARAALRRRALGWLRTNLAIKATNLAKGPPKARMMQAIGLMNWKNNPDLAGIRDPGALAGLPADEQKACRELWSEVDALLEKARVVGK